MNTKIETMSPEEFYYKPELDIKKVKTVHDCARILKFLCDRVILPTPRGCLINDFKDVAEYFDEENDSKNTRVSFRVVDDKGNDVTNNACWVLMPDGRLVANEYGDLIGRTDVHAVFDVEKS